MNSNLSSARCGFIAALLLACTPGLVQATLPEPDHVIYGIIVIGTNQVTAAKTNVLVEVRRSPGGTAISSYRMGSNPDFGNFYSVNTALEWLDLESIVNPGLVDTNSSVTGDGLYLVVKEGNIIRYQTNFVADTRGSFLQIDFGVVAPPSLIDQWKLFHFGNTNMNMNLDPTGKGQNLLADYIAGTDPNDTNAVFKLFITNNGPAEVSFFGVQTAGAGYTGLTRVYSLDSSTNLTAGFWQGVPNYTNLVGSNLTILYIAPTGTPTSQFYRARVRLQ